MQLIYLTQDDLIANKPQEVLDLIMQIEDFTVYEGLAISKMRSYLGQKYEVEVELSKKADERNDQIVFYLVNYCIGRAFHKEAPRMTPETVKEDYESAKEFFDRASLSSDEVGAINLQYDGLLLKDSTNTNKLTFGSGHKTLGYF